VLDAEPVLDDIELELAHRADDGFTLAPLRRAEELHRALLRQLLEALLELLALERVDHDHAREMLGRELGERRVADRAAAAQRVADEEHARIEDADDVA